MILEEWRNEWTNEWKDFSSLSGFLIWQNSELIAEQPLEEGLWILEQSKKFSFLWPFEIQKYLSDARYWSLFFFLHSISNYFGFSYSVVKKCRLIRFVCVCLFFLLTKYFLLCITNRCQHPLFTARDFEGSYPQCVVSHSGFSSYCSHESCESKFKAFGFKGDLIVCGPLSHPRSVCEIPAPLTR